MVSAKSWDLSKDCHLLAPVQVGLRSKFPEERKARPRVACCRRQGLGAVSQCNSLCLRRESVRAPRWVALGVLRDSEVFWWVKRSWSDGTSGAHRRALGVLCLPSFLSGRWFDVLQKVSTQLKTNLTSVTKNRADKVSKWEMAREHVAQCQKGNLPDAVRAGCLQLSVEDSLRFFFFCRMLFTTTSVYLSPSL